MKQLKEKVTYIIPTYNEEKNIVVCLDSILKQDVSAEDYEVLIIDGGSTDATISIAESYGDRMDIRILDNPRKDCGFGKVVGIDDAKYDIIALIDADNEIVQEDWLSSYVDALLHFEAEGKTCIMESYYLPGENDHPLCNYLTADLYINDPLSYYIARKPKPVELETVGDNEYQLWRMPSGWPTGANGFFVRKSFLDRYPFPGERFDESNYFSYIAGQQELFIVRVKGKGVIHHYIKGWKSFIKKRMKIGRKYFTRKSNEATKGQSWLSDNPKWNLPFFVAYIGLFGPVFLESIIRTILSFNLRWMIHPFASWISIFLYIYAFVEVKIFKRKAF